MADEPEDLMTVVNDVIASRRQVIPTWFEGWMSEPLTGGYRLFVIDREDLAADVKAIPVVVYEVRT